MATASNKLAIINSLFKLPQSAPHGTNHAGFTAADAIVRLGQFDEIDVFVEEPENVSYGVAGSGTIPFPQGVNLHLRHIRELCYCNDQYLAIYCAGAAWFDAVPYSLRPLNDPTPVISEIDVSHGRSLWTNLFLGVLSGALRPTDGFIFKSEATRRLYQNVWTHWTDAGYIKTYSPRCLVSPNPIDLNTNQRDEALRERVRSFLGIRENQVVFLTFNRLEPSTKGDFPSLIKAWSQVLQSSPNAILLLSGAMTNYAAPFVEKLKALARLTKVSHNLIILPNPFDLFADARNALMSASDVFLHVSLGVEESAPLTILEAMAHQLPPIVAGWSGMIEQVVHGVSGFVIPIRYVVAPATQSQLFWGRHSVLAHRDATSFACLVPEVFVQTVDTLARNHSLRQAVGANAFERVKSRSTIDQTAKDRVAFIRQCGDEARRSPLGSDQIVLVSIDMITRNLAYGSELILSDTVRRGQSIDTFDLGLWINERLIRLAISMQEQLDGSERKSLEELLVGVVGACGLSIETPIGETWVSEFGRHFQWICVRLIAAGAWILDPRSDDLNQSGDVTAISVEQPKPREEVANDH